MYPSSNPPRIFISYARSDGEDFARDLRSRLIEDYGFAVWQDRTEMQVGEAWWHQIVAALTSKHVEYMVLVMTPAAIDSKMVRREWWLYRHLKVTPAGSMRLQLRPMENTQSQDQTTTHCGCGILRVGRSSLRSAGTVFFMPAPYHQTAEPSSQARRRAGCISCG